MVVISFVCCVHWRDALSGSLQIHENQLCPCRAIVLQAAWGFHGSLELKSLFCVSENYTCSSPFRLWKGEPSLFRARNTLRETSLECGYWCLFVTLPLSVFPIYFPCPIFEFIWNKSKHCSKLLSLFFATQNKFDCKTSVAACTESRLVLGGF